MENSSNSKSKKQLVHENLQLALTVLSIVSTTFLIITYAKLNKLKVS